MLQVNHIRGRFAPSPTGQMHLGNVWTALLAWLQVRAAGGEMVLRMEDLDPHRSRREYSDGILRDLDWLGLDWDEGPDCGGPYGPYEQDARRHLYQQALEKLAEKDLVYPCFCTRAELASLAPNAGETEFRYPGTCRHRPADGLYRSRVSSLRLKVPPGIISFEDLVCGRVSQDLEAEVGDFVVRRSDGVHAYQLAVVVDDAAMDITHVLRGDDLLGSTPRQLLLYELLRLQPPAFAHVPLLYGEDGHRLSKRQKDLSLAVLRKRGIGPEKIIGYLAWRAGLIAQWESVRAQELIRVFALDKLTRRSVIVTDELFE